MTVTRTEEKLMKNKINIFQIYFFPIDKVYQIDFIFFNIGIPTVWDLKKKCLSSKQFNYVGLTTKKVFSLIFMNIKINMATIF